MMNHEEKENNGLIAKIQNIDELWRWGIFIVLVVGGLYFTLTSAYSTIFSVISDFSMSKEAKENTAGFITIALYVQLFWFLGGGLLGLFKSMTELKREKGILRFVLILIGIYIAVIVTIIVAIFLIVIVIVILALILMSDSSSTKTYKSDDGEEITITRKY